MQERRSNKKIELKPKVHSNECAFFFAEVPRQNLSDQGFIKMNDALKNLVELGTADNTRFDLNMKLRRIPGKLSEAQQALNKEKSSLDEVLVPWEQFESEIKEREAACKIAQETIDKFEDHMTKVSTQKEYIAAQKQVDEAKRLNKQLENEILERRVKQEELASSLEERRARYDEVLGSFKGDEGVILKEKGGLEKKVAEQEKIIASLLGNLGSDFESYYNRLDKGGKHPSVVPVIAGSCSGCRMTLPPQSYNMLIANNGTLFHCPSCSRMIFHPPTDSATDEASESEESVPEKSVAAG